MDDALLRKVEQAANKIQRKLGLPECLYNATFIELHDILAYEDLGGDLEIDLIALEAMCDKILADDSFIFLNVSKEFISQKAIDNMMTKSELEDMFNDPSLFSKSKQKDCENTKLEKRHNKKGAQIISLDSRRNKNKD